MDRLTALDLRLIRRRQAYRGRGSQTQANIRQAAGHDRLSAPDFFVIKERGCPSFLKSSEGQKALFR
jgi:hypothetical protein